MQTANTPRKVYIISALITVEIILLFSWNIVHVNNLEEELKNSGGRVGIENRTDHGVTIHIFGHDSTGVVERHYKVKPRSEFVIRDSMSEAQVVSFPPEGFVDSGILVFDDTLPLRHAPYNDYGNLRTDYKGHCIYDAVQWRYESIQEHGSPPIYRPRRIYIITDDDYNRAVDAMNELSRSRN